MATDSNMSNKTAEDAIARINLMSLGIFWEPSMIYLQKLRSELHSLLEKLDQEIHRVDIKEEKEKAEGVLSLHEYVDELIERLGVAETLQVLRKVPIVASEKRS